MLMKLTHVWVKYTQFVCVCFFFLIFYFVIEKYCSSTHFSCSSPVCGKFWVMFVFPIAIIFKCTLYVCFVCSLVRSAKLDLDFFGIVLLFVFFCCFFWSCATFCCLHLWVEILFFKMWKKYLIMVWCSFIFVGLSLGQCFFKFLNIFYIFNVHTHMDNKKIAFNFECWCEIKFIFPNGVCATSASFRWN